MRRQGRTEGTSLSVMRNRLFHRSLSELRLYARQPDDGIELRDDPVNCKTASQTVAVGTWLAVYFSAAPDLDPGQKAEYEQRIEIRDHHHRMGFVRIAHVQERG